MTSQKRVQDGSRSRTSPDDEGSAHIENSEPAKGIASDQTAQHWLAKTIILAFGVFVVGTDGFIVVGLLPDIGNTFNVSTAAAAQMVSTFSVAYALLGPLLAALTGKLSRRQVLLAGVALLAVGNAITAIAGEFLIVLAARVIAGAGAALFMASAVATAAYLGGEGHRGRAISTVTAGATLALVLGVPLGTLLGGAFGWKTAIWFVAVLALIVAAVLAVWLPAVHLGNSATLRERVAPLTDARVLRVLLITFIAFVSIFLPFTYMSAVFAHAIQGEESRIALLLLVFGIAATVGNLTAGSLADRYGPARVVIGATAGIAIVCLVMLLVRDIYVLVVVVMVFSGIFSYSVIGPQQHRIIAFASSGGVPVVTSLNTSAAYLGNFLAGAVGGLIVANSAALILPVAAVFAIAGSLLAWLLSRNTASDQEQIR